MLKIHEAELTHDISNENSKNSEEDPICNETDEEDHMIQQRISTKVFSQISQFNSNMPDDLSSSRGRGSAARGSGSSYSSSIKERRSKGQYFKFPKGKKIKTVTKEQLEADKFKHVSTCTEEEGEDNDSDAESFWGKWREERVQNNVLKKEPKAPVIYDKHTFVKFSEFSMLLHPESKDILDSEYTEEDMT